jgi:hypothetical protein
MAEESSLHGVLFVIFICFLSHLLKSSADSDSNTHIRVHNTEGKRTLSGILFAC